MDKKFLTVLLIAIMVLSITLPGCKGKVEKSAEEPGLEATDTMMPLPMENMMSAQQAAQNVIVEPAQSLASEPIPATAAFPEVAERTAATVTKAAQDRNKNIQKALKSTGFYTGAIDGKIGPRTKRAVIDFQRANGLKVDGKVGPKTLAALDKYLLRE